MNNHYKAHYILLEALSHLEDNMRHNYEKGTMQQRALANIGGLQGDLFASYILLLQEDEKGPIVGRSIVLRSILENQGTILHLKGSDRRSEQYLGYVEKMHKQLKNRVEGNKTSPEDLEWTKSKVSQRVALIADNAISVYDTLSDFTHGNNIQYFLDTKELTDAYIKAIDSYSVGMFIGFMAELGIGLDMSDEKRKLVFDATDKAGKLHK